MPKSLTCEVRNGAGWVSMGIGEALMNRGTFPMRCPECHGKVRPHRAGTTGQAAHFEHELAHVGCSFSAWDGKTRSVHPVTLD
jgi:hypothetical protein